MKFKVGDKIIRNKKVNYYDITTKGWIGTVIETNENYFNAKGLDGDKYLFLKYEDFDLYNVIKTKGNLQFGDIITLRNGERYVFADNCIFGEDSGYCRDADDIFLWHNDLIYDGNSDYDIVKVERAGNVIYEREENKVKEMTIAEISKELGYEVKVVKEYE